VGGGGGGGGGGVKKEDKTLTLREENWARARIIKGGQEDHDGGFASEGWKSSMFRPYMHLHKEYGGERRGCEERCMMKGIKKVETS